MVIWREVSLLNSKEIKDLLGDDLSYRGDCPSCGGKGSFSANITDTGEVAWICFKASCKERGRADVPRSLEQIVKYLLNTHVKSISNFELPSHFTSIYSNQHAYEYFERMNAVPLFKDREIRLMYDPKQDRAVFVIQRGGSVVDAIGRAIGKNPMKWYRYGNSIQSFLYRKNNTLVITEDIPSAVTVAYSYSAMGLMGTELSDVDMRDALQFTNCIVALDPDAYSKGILIAKRLSPFVNVEAIRIPDDLKYFKPREAKELINGIKTIKFID